MAGSSLLTLLDDIATLLDDIAILSKTALKKTSGVLGDDLAVNAEQVSGVKASRELPVVMAVARGSFKNKLILVPAALLISWFASWLIKPLLMLGGAYLCFEGFEKLHELFSKHEDVKPEEHVKKLVKTKEELLAFEQKKIQGAIRTDFVLSAEIIVISLGTVADADLTTKALVLSAIAVLITLLVYGLVAAIVKMDDAGLYLQKREGVTLWLKFQRLIGRGLLSFAPKLMKSLTWIGTIAMFLVGGGILMHGTPGTEHLVMNVQQMVAQAPGIGWMLSAATNSLMGGLYGILSGGLIALILSRFKSH